MWSLSTLLKGGGGHFFMAWRGMFKVDVEGLGSVEEGLFKLKGSTAKSVTRRGMKMALEPMRQLAEDLAPIGATRDLSESIKISSRVSRSHRSAQKSDLEMYMGPGGGTKSIVQEFGSYNQSGTPFMRPAWDAESRATLARFVKYMRVQVPKSVARHERKVARDLKKKGGK